MKKINLLFGFLLLCSGLFAQSVDTLAGFYSNGKVGRKIPQYVYTLPYTAGKYFNGYGNFVGLNTDSITEGSTNLFYTNARVRAALSLNFTTTGTSGAASGSYNSSTGVFTINIPQYSAGGGGGGGAADSTYFWQYGGNAPTAGWNSRLGTNNFITTRLIGGGRETMYVDSLGRVGIGGLSSGALFDVKGVSWLDSIRVSRGAGGIYRFSNIGIGDSVLMSNTTGTANIGIGDSVLRLNTTGSRNTAVGSGAMTAVTTGSDNTSVGNSALGVTTGQFNTAVGRSALSNMSTQSGNTAVGYTAGTNATGSNNTFVGYVANGGSGSNNTIVGASSGSSGMTGSGNTGVGQGVKVAQSGSNNTGVGYSALASANSNSAATAIGQSALALLNSGAAATALGYNAGTAYGASTANGVTQADSSIFIGYYAMAQGNAQKNQIVIAGHDATGLGSNSTAIGNTGTTKAAIAGRVAINGNANNSPSTIGYLSAQSEPMTGAVLDILGIGAVKIPDITQAQRDALSLGAPLASVTIASAGSGQTNGNYALTFTGGGGSGAAGYCTVSGNLVTSVTISSWGNGYTSAPTVIMATAGGTSATFTATVRSVKGLTLFCTDCTANDASTGVTQTYNGSTWKNNW